jgi:hypothetical protein
VRTVKLYRFRYCRILPDEPERGRGGADPMAYVWLPNNESDVDQHAAFRLTFHTYTAETAVTIEHCCVSWYVVYVDGVYLAEGPTRFVGDVPFSATTTTQLYNAGTHVVAIHAHSVGEQTRILLKTSPVAFCKVAAVDPTAAPISPPAWTCSSMSQWYKPQLARLSSLLGWTEQVTLCDAQQRWTTTSFDDTTWATPVPAANSSGLQYPPAPLETTARPASSIEGALKQVAAGTLVERHGYASDDVPARFRLRQLTTTSGATHGGAAGEGLDCGAPQGFWWRFDALRCQLLRPVIELRAPSGAVVEVCYCQALIDGKASPYHPLCGSATCYLDQYSVGSDVGDAPLTVVPLEPRGCRYVEVHVTLDDGPYAALQRVALLGCNAMYRAYDAYHTEPLGRFAGDAVLERIWRTGSETTRSCVEDTCIDGPCRERGQWTGDTLAVTLPNLVCMYDDGTRPAIELGRFAGGRALLTSGRIDPWSSSVTRPSVAAAGVCSCFGQRARRHLGQRPKQHVPGRLCADLVRRRVALPAGDG